jgi:hypothetical protein
MTQELVCLSFITTYEAGTHAWITAIPFLKASYSVIVVGITTTYKKGKPKHFESSIMERIARQGNIYHGMGRGPLCWVSCPWGACLGKTSDTSSRTGN